MDVRTLALLTVIAVAVTGCAAAYPSDAAPSPIPTVVPAPRPEPTDDGGVTEQPAEDVEVGATSDALLNAPTHPLEPGVLPEGYAWVDSVPTGEGTIVSHVYGGPDGPTGPTIYVHTGIRPDDVTAVQTGLTWQELPEVSDRFDVSIAGEGAWHFVDIDADTVSVHLVAHKAGRDELLATTTRFLTLVEASP